MKITTGHPPRRPAETTSHLGIVTAGLLLASVVSAQEAEPNPHHAEHRQHTAHHRFEDAERWSRQFDDPARDAWQKPEEVVALMELEPGMTVADIGAGTGYFLGRLAAAVGSTGTVLGLDIEQSMVDFMSERAEREGWTEVEARRVEPDDPGLADGTVDRILIVDTWHHIANRRAYSTKLNEALKAGGRVVIVDFTRDSSHGPPPAQRVQPEAVVAELEAAGLEASIEPETLPEQYIVVGRKQ